MNALVPARTHSPQLGVAQCAGEGIAADIRIVGSAYVIRLASTRVNVIGRLIGVRHGGTTVEVGGIAVAAGSIGGARLALAAVPPSQYEALYLEIRSEEALMRIDAPRPAVRSRRALLRFSTLTLACATALVLYALARRPETIVMVRQLVSAPAVAAPAPARIVSLSVRRDANAGGETVLASYFAIADEGKIALVDPAGKVVASAPFTHIGTNRLSVAPAYRTVPLVAKLSVRRGGTETQTSVAVTPAADLGEAESANEPEGVTPIDLAPSRGMFTGTVALEGRAVAGRPLSVAVGPQLRNVHLELQDETGATLAERDLPPGAKRMRFALPQIEKPATYYVVVRYARGGGEETVVRTVVAATR